MNKVKLDKLVDNVFKNYPQNGCLYIGKYRFKAESDKTPEIDICYPWEATDVEDMPLSLLSRGPIVTLNPKQCIDELLMFFLDNKPTDYFTVVLRDPGKDYYMFIDRESEIYTVK